MEIMNKLQMIQQELQAPKGLYNDFGNYAYRSCEGILEAVKPLLQKANCVIVMSDSLEYVGNRYYIKASAKLIDCGDDSSYEVCAYAREEDSKKGMDSSQITGASSSYARKYALNGLFAIDDNKDSDTTNTGDTESKKVVKVVSKSAEEKAPEQAIDTVNCKCADCGAEISDKVAKYSKEKIGKVLCYNCQQEYKKLEV